MNRQLTAGWNSWLEMVVERRAAMELMRRGLSALVNRKLTMAFRSWLGAATAARLRRLAAKTRAEKARLGRESDEARKAIEAQIVRDEQLLAGVERIRHEEWMRAELVRSRVGTLEVDAAAAATALATRRRAAAVTVQAGYRGYYDRAVARELRAQLCAQRQRELASAERERAALLAELAAAEATAQKRLAAERERAAEAEARGRRAAREAEARERQRLQAPAVDQPEP